MFHALVQEHVSERGKVTWTEAKATENTLIPQTEQLTGDKATYAGADGTRCPPATLLSHRKTRGTSWLSAHLN